MQERLVDKFAFIKAIVRQENGAGEYMPTTVDLFPSVFMLILLRALFGPAVAHPSWMHVRSVANHALGSVQKKGRRANQFMPTTVIQSTTSNNLAPIT
mmetsp:Transcript_13512/g.19250  ORF Transcript_13512/g.19250 Transcript_13512/m.19250 type:complete len:98 (-) Transcript_13512:66-359(-)